MIRCEFLNYILDTKDFSIVTLNNIDESFFDTYAPVFRFIKQHVDNYGVVPDELTVMGEFPWFQRRHVTESSEYLVDGLYKAFNRDKLVEGYNAIREKLLDNDTEGAFELAVSLANEAVKSKQIECVNLLEDTSRYDNYVDRGQRIEEYYVNTGFPELDAVIGGWDRKEELATIAARTNQGKSWILLKSAAEAFRQGLRVGIYSGEMSEDKVGYRLDTLLSNISNYKITHGTLDVANEYKKYMESLKEKYPNGALLVLTPTMIGGPATVTALRAFIERENLDILFVDQHSLLEDERRAKNPVERAANISRDLKNLQVMKKIPIITVSQQNRVSTENGVGTEHIAQSDRIAQDSTVVLFFEQKDGVLTLSLVKSRDSVNNQKLKYDVNFDKGIFEYHPENGDAQGDVGIGAMQDKYEMVHENAIEEGEYF